MQHLFIDHQRSAQHVSGNILPNFRSVRLRFLQHTSMVSCCCGRPGVRRAAGWHYVYGVKEVAWLKQLPSRTRSATLPLSEPPAYHNNRIPGYYMPLM